MIAIVLALAALAPSPHTIDLANGRFDGHTILGLTPPQVQAVLGKPNDAEGDPSQYKFVWMKGGTLQFGVFFVNRGGRQRAATLVFETGRYRDPKVGDLLARSPSSFSAAVRKQYGYRVVKPLHHDGAIDVGELRAPAGPLHITFGTTPQLGTFVTIWKARTG